MMFFWTGRRSRFIGNYRIIRIYRIIFFVVRKIYRHACIRRKKLKKLCDLCDFSVFSVVSFLNLFIKKNHVNPANPVILSILLFFLIGRRSRFIGNYRITRIYRIFSFLVRKIYRHACIRRKKVKKTLRPL